MYITETHLHTSDSSKCGKISAAEMMKLYADAGYTTVFVSDHFSPSFFERLGDITWKEKISIFFAGYYRALHEGKKYGLNVLMSAEICFENNPNHYLAYGITKELLTKHENLCSYTIEQFYKIASENGVFVVHAHPYRDNNTVPSPNGIDAIEVYNSNPRHNDYNDLAKKYAKENGFFMTAGSDAHRYEDVAGTGIMTQSPITSAEAFVKAIKSGNFEIYAAKPESADN